MYDNVTLGEDAILHLKPFLDRNHISTASEINRFSLKIDRALDVVGEDVLKCRDLHTCNS
jgi:hypothetical protein